VAVGSASLYATDSPNFQSSVQVLIRRELVEALRRELSWMPPGVCTPAAFVNGTGTPPSQYTFRTTSILDLAIDIPPVPLVEGTPPTPVTLATTFQDVIAKQFGKTVKSTDLAILESPFNIPQQLTEKIVFWGKQTLDELARQAWLTGAAGEQVYSPTDSTGAGATAATNAPRLETFMRAAAFLADRGVPKVGNTYVALISSGTALALQTQTGQLALNDAMQFADPGALKTGYLGTWRGIAFHQVGRAIKPTGTTVRDIVCGADALVYSELSQISSGYVPPQPSAADPLGQTALAGTKFLFGANVTTVGGADVASSLRYAAVLSTPPAIP
jgi:N4-gp56 family major capsid protein